MGVALPFVWVDVFAAEPFCGNQLMVFSAPSDLPLTLMQQITREVNHSETTFLQGAETAAGDWRLRILIPTLPTAKEIPFAGHPILGSACVAVRAAAQSSVVRFETGTGIIPVDVTPVADGVWDARMVQPVPRVVWSEGQPGAPAIERAAVAAALGLHPGDLVGDLPIEAVNNGMQTVLVPIGSVEAVQRAKPDLGGLRHLFGRDGQCVMTLALGGIEPDSHVHCRVFCPFDLITEDPATGSANGPLGEYLVRHGAVAQTIVRSEQGDIVGRPSRLIITVERQYGQTAGVFVGGRVVAIGGGELRLPR